MKNHILNGNVSAKLCMCTNNSNNNNIISNDRNNQTLNLLSIMYMPGAKLPHSILPKSLQGRNKLTFLHFADRSPER